MIEISGRQTTMEANSPEAEARITANQADSKTESFLNDIWAVFEKHNLILDCNALDRPLVIREYEDDETIGWLFGMVEDTTRDDFSGL